jgi:hypothetical protein
MEIKTSPERIARSMALVVAVLLALDIAASVSRFFLGFDAKIVYAFSFGWEKSFPTYISGVFLLFCAVLLAIASAGSWKAAEKYRVHWCVLSAIFVFLSMDEMLEIHEALIVPVRQALHLRGMLRFAWVIPYGAFLIVFVFAYRRFLRDLPVKSRNLFMAAGAVYVLGALGVELLGARHYDLHGGDNFAYVMIQTVEELLEMSGLTIFAYGIADLIRDRHKAVRIDFGSSGTGPGQK